MTTTSERVIRLRYSSMCRHCRVELAVGSEARWDPTSRTTACVRCMGHADPFAAPPPVVDKGVAGRSAQAEADRRLNKGEAGIRKRFPRIGGVILAFTEPPQTTRSWAQGAVGERKVADRLSKPESAEAIVVLHDRRVPGTRGNVDHVVIGPAGVYVVDTKRYLKKRIEARSNGTLFRPEPPRLFVGGRDQTKLVEAMDWQVAAVRGIVDELGAEHQVAVMPVLCFVDGEWEMLSGPFQIGEVHVTGPRALAKHVTRPGALNLYERRVLSHHLAARLPAA